MSRKKAVIDDKYKNVIDKMTIVINLIIEDAYSVCELQEIVEFCEKCDKRLSLHDALEQAFEMHDLYTTLTHVRQRLFTFDACFTKADCERMIEHLVADCDDYFTT